MGVANFFFSSPAAQERMHHPALNRAGADDGDFDDEVGKGSRLKAGEHPHLRARFNLKNPHRIGLTNHFINNRIFGWNCRKR